MSKRNIAENIAEKVKNENRVFFSDVQTPQKRSIENEEAEPSPKKAKSDAELPGTKLGVGILSDKSFASLKGHVSDASLQVGFNYPSLIQVR